MYNIVRRVKGVWEKLDVVFSYQCAIEKAKYYRKYYGDTWEIDIMKINGL